MKARTATINDAAEITRIYNQGIMGRLSTFEIRERTIEEIEAWFDGIHPIVVIEDENRVVGFAATFDYRSRDCYRGVAEFSVYVEESARGKGVGKLAMLALIEEATHRGFWKILSRVFVENTASRKLLQSTGFREVGIYEKHGQLDGRWRDVVIVERLIEENL